MEPLVIGISLFLDSSSLGCFGFTMAPSLLATATGNLGFEFDNIAKPVECAAIAKTVVELDITVCCCTTCRLRQHKQGAGAHES